MNRTHMNQQAEKEFSHFKQQFNLTQTQTEQFKTYCELLLEWNKKFNLTTIATIPGIIAYHFADSLKIQKHVAFSTISGLADIGTGAGFPGLALKICNPDLPVYLIEVNQKKITFLSEVIEQLGLANIELIDLDWRTFLRKTDFTIDLFCARASLSVSELLRMFKPASPYNNAHLIYWAADDWQPEKKEELFVEKEIHYAIKSKRRKYVFFKRRDSAL